MWGVRITRHYVRVSKHIVLSQHANGYGVRRKGDVGLFDLFAVSFVDHLTSSLQG